MEIEKYIYSECFDPVEIEVYNGITDKYEIRKVPCGKCYHCKITKINEWVTRMIIQSNYSKYVYFGTLTYSGKNPTILNDECLSIKTTFNKNNTLTDTPLVLRKDHVQKFFKRLRKNTGIKIQYAYCGEYGSTYSRPHYHYIIWSNDPISKLSVYKAWSSPGKYNQDKKYVIGRIEHRDIKNEPWLTGDKDNTAVFKYVCKYIQKFDFKFEELKNINEHYKNFNKNFKDYVTIKHSIESDQDSFFCYEECYYTSENLDDYLKKLQIKDWHDYKKAFSPFFHCSKKPAIGFQYVQDNLSRFQDCDFRLFGLHGDYIFPLYFVRKTKESLCPLKAQSLSNQNTTSYSRLPKMATLLEDINLAREIAENTDQIVQLFQYKDTICRIESGRRYHDLKELKRLRLPEEYHYYEWQFRSWYLDFTNHDTKVKYVFKGDKYALYTTTDKFIRYETIENVLNLIKYYYEQLKNKILLPLYYKSQISSDKKDSVINECGGIEKFKQLKSDCVANLMNVVKRNQDRYKLTKTFE